MKYALPFTVLFITSACARRTPHMLPSQVRGTNAFRYPFAWGLDTPEMTDVEVDNKKTTDVQKKVKEVKRLQEQSDKTKETPMRGRRLSLFPLPYDHLDDIFLSSAGVDQ